MKTPSRWLLSCALLACLCGSLQQAHAQDSDSPTDQGDRQIVSIMHDSYLPAGESAEAAVSVMGNTKVDGDVSDSAVAVLGNVTLNGSAGDSAVAVLGDVYVNGKVNHDVVSVLGNVKLGPQAVVGGEVTNVLGNVERSPTAVVQGGTTNVMSGIFGSMDGLHSWIQDCLLYGRPLAPNSDVSWAWWFALAALALYVLIAAVFQDGVRRCLHTLETHPGPSLLTTIIAVLLLPIVLLALVITVIGIAIIPLLWMALICAGIFGRVVAIAWIGGRCLRPNTPATASRAMLEVLVGGLIVLLLYMVPVVGFFLFTLLGWFGFGAVLYTLLLATRGTPAAARPVSGGTPPGQGGASGTGGMPPGGTAASAAGSPAWSANAAEAAAADASATGASTANPPPPPPPPPPPGVRPMHTAEVLDVATLPRAGFWIRMLALLIDLILVGVALSWVHHGGRGMMLLLATYGAIMWKLKGTTVGGIVCDLKVVRIGGGPLDWGTAIVRALGCFLSLVIAGLGFIWIAVDHDHQAWHDKIAGTVVVRVPKGVGLV
jgi:uncharacterized RDD family membrane protein YckC